MLAYRAQPRTDWDGIPRVFHFDWIARGLRFLAQPRNLAFMTNIMFAVWAQLELYQGQSMNMFDQACAGEGFEPIHGGLFEYSLHG
jgi:hypothetical protein